MRCRVGAKKVACYRKQTRLDVLSALVRGGTEHRIDLLLGDGSVVYWYRDGTMEKAENLSWDVEKWKLNKQE